MLQIFNSLTRKKEVFKPINPSGKVGLYVCGMTVYDYCHIGHARILVVFDIIARHLREEKYELNYIRNITDIDDKIIQRANENNQNITELTDYFIEKMNEDEVRLGNILPNYQPKATEYISEIIQMIKTLIAKKIAYLASNKTVYFHTKKFKNYGKLSGKKLDELKKGARVEVDEAKKNALDFVLWKPSKENEPSWESPWGNGRPGWHIECSAMSCFHLGNEFDLHGGGADLKFPHHENEIAQSQGASNQSFAKSWIHVGFVNIDSKKMSKSLNNFFTIREVFKHYRPEVVRYFLLSSQYRKPLNYSEKNLNLAHQALSRLYGALRNDDTNQSESSRQYIKAQAKIDANYLNRFNSQMNDDFNTPKALAVLFDLVKIINKQKQKNSECEIENNTDENIKKLAKLQKTLIVLSNRLGILKQNPDDFFKPKKNNALINSNEIEKKIKQRNQARANKDFKKADEIRAELRKKGIILEDKSNQTIWRIFSD